MQYDTDITTRQGKTTYLLMKNPIVFAQQLFDIGTFHHRKQPIFLCTWSNEGLKLISRKVPVSMYLTLLLL